MASTASNGYDSSDDERPLASAASAALQKQRGGENKIASYNAPTVSLVDVPARVVEKVTVLDPRATLTKDTGMCYKRHAHVGTPPSQTAPATCDDAQGSLDALEDPGWCSCVDRHELLAKLYLYVVCSTCTSVCECVHSVRP